MRTTSQFHLKTQRNLCKILREKQYVGKLSLAIFYKIKSFWYTFDSLAKIQLINKENCEYQCLRKMSFLEIFHFQGIYLSRLQCRPSLKSLPTFTMIRNNLTLCRCTYSSKSNTILFHCPRHSLFQFLLSKKQTYINDFIQ